MNRTKLRVVMARYPPHVIADCGRHFPRLRPSLQCPNPGWCVEIMVFLAEFLNMDVEPVIMQAAGRPDIGAYINNSWTGALAFVHNGSADTVCAFYQSTQKRREYFAFTDPLYMVMSGFIVRRRHRSYFDIYGVLSVFAPYEFGTWMAMAVSLVLVFLTLTLIVKYEVKRKLRRKIIPLWEMFWKVLRLQLQQPEIFEFRFLSGYVLLSCFALLQCLVVASLYQSWILWALLRTPSTDVPLRHANELIPQIRSGNLQLVTDTMSTWFYDKLNNSQDLDYILLRKATEANPIVRVGTIGEALDLVESGSYALHTQLDGYSFHQATNRCELRFVVRGMPERGCHLVFDARSPLVKMFNRAIAMNLGFVRRTFSKYFQDRGFESSSTMPRCPTSRPVYLTEPLGMGALSGLAMMIGIGYAAGVIVLLLEHLYSQYDNNPTV